MRVKLLRKLATVIDGVDLSGHKVGDLIDCPPQDAALLIAEGWADIAPDAADVAPVESRLPLTTAADRPSRRRRRRR